MRQRSNGLVILVVSIVAGLLAALLSVSFLRGMARTTTVLVALQDIQPFTPLTPAMFAAQQFPGVAVPADAITDASEVQGRFARTLILSGAPLRSGYLASSSGKAGSLAAKLTESGQPGTRALAISVDQASGVAGTLEAGDKVDIIAAVKLDRQGAPSTQLSKIIAQGVPVLHKSEEETDGRGTVVVQVTPTQAEEIAFAETAGKIYLATNPYRTEKEAPKTPGVTPDSFIQRYGGR